ncbi:AraC family transcriptional regulator [Lacrimispora amygdalina]|uniref:AraC family transcriptional regulator n=1 Tax=Lacrimispora amygdalina TaxID=253257 RepID=UPI000BE2E9E1|nr:AraC family transcriptional regulator [Lacrimispora amygdalina]
MDWISGIQKAVDYVEENITMNLDYNEIAKQAYSSGFHFQRVFGLLCGFTLGDYIRMRRLTLAGGELAGTNARILDIAVKYGYETQESFSRAFTRFHGVSPSQARKGASLKSFSRLCVKLILDGATITDYRIEKRVGFQMICKPLRVSAEKELTSARITEFWQQCRKDETIPTLCRYIPNDSLFGNCMTGISFGADAVNPGIPYAIGVPYNGITAADKDFLITAIPSHTYAVFPCTGTMPEAFSRLYKQIYSEFFPANDYQPCGGTDFEVYPSDDIKNPGYTCEIWVAVEKK